MRGDLRSAANFPSGSERQGGAIWTPKHEKNPDAPSAAPRVYRVPSQEPVKTFPTPQSVESFSPEVTRIGKSIVIKGEVVSLTHTRHEARGFAVRGRLSCWAFWSWSSVTHVQGTIS